MGKFLDEVKMDCFPLVVDGDGQCQLYGVPTRYWDVGVVVVDTCDLFGSVDIKPFLPSVYFSCGYSSFVFESPDFCQYWYVFLTDVWGIKVKLLVSTCALISSFILCLNLCQSSCCCAWYT